ncbi:Methyltransferase domain-containing protein [Ruminococcus sp. YE71]|uniref:class I SAM-dependent methyltransferase n=1 Tax=unclassified Ruminococcus TaxID=2608920 RepID=UPI00088A5D39|nr:MULTISPECIES: class I SAM-dependent methyltransferase [unclassified Ruminococcus]SDA18841.1 Methyltransferase domain-containing protein [Ruminococcus sp. YE78]SFW29232.1 Methyltransferase domain-containing protein [Ruminococcus sp. YE71]
MLITDKNIDGGKPFDWGRTSSDYAKYRDIYPEEFYRQLTERGLGVGGQKCLDLGTGTGVLPRNMYRFGAEWTGADISDGQIAEAKRLAAEQGMDITFITSPTEDIDFPDGSFDLITACQCFWYFDHERTSPMLARMLKSGGKLAVMQLAWLPADDEIAGRSEELVLRFSPNWTGAGFTRKPVFIDEAVLKHFRVTERIGFDSMVHFTRESWHGRMRACRGVGASLSGAELAEWEREHRELLEKTAPEEFDVLHYAAMAILEPV